MARTEVMFFDPEAMPDGMDIGDDGFPVQTPPSQQETEESLVRLLGEYRAVKGMPGWYLRPLRLRQQIEASRLFLQMQERGNDEARALEDMTQTARFLLHRQEGAQMRQATLDEVLDYFDLDSLDRLVLRPMGYGLSKGQEEVGSVPND